jgi:RNA polymerase sigma factor for flagellar operon FliA
MEQFVELHISMVKAIARRLHNELPVHVDVEDLISAGIVGLISAKEHFKASFGVPANMYFKHRVRGAMLDYLRHQDNLTRTQRIFKKRYDAIARKLAETLHRNPTEEEIAEQFRMSVNDIRQRLVNVNLISLSVTHAKSSSHDTDDQTTLQVADKSIRQDVELEKAQLSRILWACIAELKPRWQRVLTMYYLEEMTMKEIGAVLGVNESRISQLRSNAIERLGFLLESRGLNFENVFVRCLQVGVKGATA